MEKIKIRIAIITNIITTYRKGFYDRLFIRNDIYVRVFCQDSMPGMNLISIHEQYKDNVKIIKYISAKKEKIAWQFLPWREIINDFDVVFIDGNPRVLSDALFATYLRIINKKVVLWTMAHSYRGNKFAEYIRLIWSRIFPLIFVYTDKEAEFLRIKGFKSQFILGMNNGLDQKKIEEVIQLWPEEKLKEWKLTNGFESRIVLVSTARLDPKNKFELVLFAIPKIVEKIPNLLWCAIGGGHEEVSLKNLSRTLRIEDHVSFIGPIYEEEKLAPYFLSSQLFVHPASVGLSMLHAFGYGLPVITHDCSTLHGPEYGAFTPGLTGRNYIYNDISSLSQTIIQMLDEQSERNRMKESVQKIVRELYNVDVMEERFVAMANYAANHN
ncbi:MAG TPA: hypothetical protein DDW27_17255 [Bacteroidales bacterium]|nr:hypothetical protein [Bacteroidales bacterium]